MKNGSARAIGEYGKGKVGAIKILSFFKVIDYYVFYSLKQRRN